MSSASVGHERRADTANLPKLEGSPPRPQSLPHADPSCHFAGAIRAWLNGRWRRTPFCTRLPRAAGVIAKARAGGMGETPRQKGHRPEWVAREAAEDMLLRPARIGQIKPMQRPKAREPEVMHAAVT